MDPRALRGQGFPNTCPGRRSMSILATWTTCSPAPKTLTVTESRPKCGGPAGGGPGAAPPSCSLRLDPVPGWQTARDELAHLSIPTRPPSTVHLLCLLHIPHFSSSVPPFSSLFFPLVFFIPVFPAVLVCFHHPPWPVTPALPRCCILGFFLLTHEPSLLGSETWTRY